MKRLAIGLGACALLVWVVTLNSCGNATSIGKGEIDKAFPPSTKSKLEADLQRAGKLNAYKEMQKRDAEYLKAGQMDAPLGNPSH